MVQLNVHWRRTKAPSCEDSRRVYSAALVNCKLGGNCAYHSRRALSSSANSDSGSHGGFDVAILLTYLVMLVSSHFWSTNAFT